MLVCLLLTLSISSLLPATGDKFHLSFFFFLSNLELNRRRPNKKGFPGISSFLSATFQFLIRAPPSSASLPFQIPSTAPFLSNPNFQISLYSSLSEVEWMVVRTLWEPGDFFPRRIGGWREEEEAYWIPKINMEHNPPFPYTCLLFLKPTFLREHPRPHRGRILNPPSPTAQNRGRQFRRIISRWGKQSRG